MPHQACSCDDAALLLASRRVAEAAGASGVWLATAESCTGGWIAKCLTDLAGSSAWFRGGLVSYSNEAKRGLLGVQAQALQTHGAVSEVVVRQMAEGACRAMQADRTVAVSGIAGPGGGSAHKPVGTVWIAWAAAGLTTRAECFHFAGDREAVRRQSVLAALTGLEKTLTG
ncbi:nicotinamide-nucleotide amidohydrolase family protein [Oleiagrimonas sp. C23AA]|uniref:CinA family protein n=1 Tax=Oleiagrimonas sp. C23AA TaxID=2719047 RepID=UPI00141EA4AF|nr:nicotinamide-nucleotide amidohydrolase family protein [Oleiagrimonas sp. C23AA]NII10277.1 CinA family protein [Oleiagrimonas sp. C23AA]